MPSSDPHPKPRATRRRLLAGLGTGALGLLALRWFGPRILRAGPVLPLTSLSDAARSLVAAAFDGLRRERVIDLHVHVAGLGGGGSGCWVNPELASRWHPLERLRYELFLGAAGVPEDARADERYVARLVEMLAAGMDGVRLLLLAFDARVRADGSEDLARTMFRVPDAYVCDLAQGHAGFLACASVHPNRTDALTRLEQARARGAVAIKWLPSAMGIDPAAPSCAPYYRKLVELGLPLLVHTGEELAVWSGDDQELGNPLRLRPALAAGVTVVALHCASLGVARDLDRAGGEPRPAFELFQRLLAEQGPDGRLYGELAALTQVNREPEILRALLGGAVPEARLLNGSDYPVVAIDPLTSLGRLVRNGFLAPEERAPLREIFGANPLLFDLVLKRRLACAGPGGPQRFASEVFETARLFDKL